MSGYGSFTTVPDTPGQAQARRDASALLQAWNEGPDRFGQQLALLMDELHKEIHAGYFSLTNKRRDAAYERIVALVIELATLAGTSIIGHAAGLLTTYTDVLQQLQAEVRASQEQARQRAILAGLRGEQPPG